MRFRCNKVEACSSCAECCHFRESNDLTEDEEFSIKKKLFSKTGAIYLYPLSRYTINITPEEKETLEKQAKEKNIQLKILPKKVLIIADKIVVYDYFLDHDVCPFLSKENRCIIYEHRPKICRDFPKINYTPEDFDNFSKDKEITKEDYEGSFEKVKNELNNYSHLFQNTNSKQL